ncbi:hypothetical protein H696_04420 [Fonticula alba]|uniref:ornithine decarboxylase n=1 Tax=Fonticula alba TaxID=691883 RepID=A0A058Z437_FONAL|nr:hypothetical protein H696_04420 [Fonticula alba]KCV69000.1 hypothetical protein H696_04420 [Fonticula alba]|eukprot:XP_009496571.1 hypothetical protein H696_04420 [Fonticula alba]
MSPEQKALSTCGLPGTMAGGCPHKAASGAGALSVAACASEKPDTTTEAGAAACCDQAVALAAQTAAQAGAAPADDGTLSRAAAAVCRAQGATIPSVLEALSSPEANPDALPFFVCDLNVVRERLALWRRELPDVVPHYAIKCCPDPRLMQTLADLGASFDCASISEIRSVLALGVAPERIIYANPTKPASHIRQSAAVGVDLMTFDNAEELRKMHDALPISLADLGASFDCASISEIRSVLALGVAPERIIYANPTKPASHIRQSAAVGVDLMTFDNAEELRKMRQEHPGVRAVLRILADDSKSVCAFGRKFGAHPHTTRALLARAQALGVRVVGVSFHVGSGCFDPESFADAVRRVGRVFAEAAALGMPQLELVDIGGGFPGVDNVDGAPFHEVAAALRPELARFPPGLELVDIGGGFPGVDNVDGAPFHEVAAALRPELARFPPGVRFIGEPGRFFAAPAFSLAVNVTSRRRIPAVPGSDEGADDAAATTAALTTGLAAADSGAAYDFEAIAEAAREARRAAGIATPSPGGASPTGSTEFVVGPPVLSFPADDNTDVQPGDQFMYYVNDGVYGSFNCIQFDHARVIPAVLRRSGEPCLGTFDQAALSHALDAISSAADNSQADTRSVTPEGEVDGDLLHTCSVWGPTCDSIDLIVPETRLPRLSIGDWLAFRNMGAYTLTAASEFNGFAKASVFYIPLREE